MFVIFNTTGAVNFWVYLNLASWTVIVGNSSRLATKDWIGDTVVSVFKPLIPLALLSHMFFTSFSITHRDCNYTKIFIKIPSPKPSDI